MQLSFENINSPETEGYDVDYVKVIGGLGHKMVRMRKPEDLAPAFRCVRKVADELKVPVVVECVLEHTTSIPMSTTLGPVDESKPFAGTPGGTPTTVLPLEPKRS